MHGFRRGGAGYVVLLVCLTMMTGCVDQPEQESVPGTEDTTAQQVDAPGQEPDAATRLAVEQALGSLAAEASVMTALEADSVFAMLHTYLQENPHFYGAAFAFAPQGEAGSKSAPYVFRQEDTLLEKNLIDSYDYTAPEQTWYFTPVATKAPVWTEPYFDEGGGDVWMVTYAIPVYARADTSQLLGVVTSDVLVAQDSEDVQ